MAHAVGANQPLRGYESEIFCGACVTACTALVNPILGAAMGMYFVTDVTTNLIADHFRLGEGSPLGRIVRVALTTLAALGAAFATFCSLMGTAVALTPGAMGVAISVLCVTILASLLSYD